MKWRMPSWPPARVKDEMGTHRASEARDPRRRRRRYRPRWQPPPVTRWTASRHIAAWSRLAGVALHLPAGKTDRHLADGSIKAERALDRFLRGLGPSHDFDQGHQVGGVKGMADHAALRVPAAGLDRAHHDPRGAGGEDDVRREQGVEGRKNPDLEAFPLRAALLDELRALDRGGEEIGAGNEGAREKRRAQARVFPSPARIRARVERMVFSAPGAGSVALTSSPRARNCAAQPLPISPEPTTATRPIGAGHMATRRRVRGRVRPDRAGRSGGRRRRGGRDREIRPPGPANLSPPRRRRRP